MIAGSARLCQILGLPKSVGEIYGLLFLSAEPLSLDEIAVALRISKGSASTGTRQLASLQIIRQVWVQGERRDYYEVDPDAGLLLKIACEKFLKPRLKASRDRLGQIIALLEADLADGQISEEEHKVFRNRLERIAAIQAKIDEFIPLAEKLL